ncbi:unnamed protein product [Soboliphyme baturini]|uniref:Myelin expression factor 2 n=1 Tax=Soboliphyme baturini TaxID=241478 RepID=A0A183IHW2_9BILA|nr:unnamed protein product [Soboliphyme baturini]
MALTDKKEDHSDKMVYISNIPYDIRWTELKDLIREKAGDVSFVEMIETAEGKSKGCAVVEFKDRESIKKCVEQMHRMQIKDRFIVVKEIKEPEKFFKTVKEETGVDFLANKSGPKSLMELSVKPVGTDMGLSPFPTYGLSIQFLKQLGVEGPLCSRVFVANVGHATDGYFHSLKFQNSRRLPFNVGPSKLKELFSLSGQVVDVDLHLDKDGRSKGLAVIEYSHPIEAIQAISLFHNQTYYDRTLTVKMDRFEKIKETRRPGELPPGLRSIGMGLGNNGTSLTKVSQLLNSGCTASGRGAMHEAALLRSNMGSNMPLSTSDFLSSYPQGHMGGNFADMSNAVSPFNGGPSRVMDSVMSGAANSVLSRGGLSYYSSMNLPANYTWQTLRDRLRGFGDIEFADIVQPRVGKVRFRTSMDAEKAAVAINGMLIEGRPITVDLAIID